MLFLILKSVLVEGFFSTNQILKFSLPAIPFQQPQKVAAAYFLVS